MKKLSSILFALVLSLLLLVSCGIAEMPSDSIPSSSDNAVNSSDTVSGSDTVYTIDTVPEFNGVDAFVAINNNKPEFTESELVNESYEYYSALDSLGRCGYTMACVGRDIMPTEDRGNIGQVKPTGWHTVKYDIVDGKYLYNRCHLIGYQLTGENANTSNLITGTRYLNIEGMLPFENMIADYVKESGNHVIYRVTPIFDGDNLLARGVQMEAVSVEDNGDGIMFNIYAYNAQPGITIDYKTGSSMLAAGGEANLNNSQHVDSSDVNANDKDTDIDNNSTQTAVKYVLNTNSKKFHKIGCNSAEKISAANRDESNKSRDAIIADGYEPCKICKP